MRRAGVSNVCEIKRVAVLFRMGFLQAWLWSLLEVSQASRAKVPPPTSERKIKPSSILTSVRASCSVPQKPFLANKRILVEYKATAISMRSGRVASRVRNPSKSRVPHTISTIPTKGGHDLWPGNTNLYKSSDPQGLREQKLLHAFGQEDPAHKNAD